MLQAKISDIVGIINKIAPPSLAEDWDNVGVQVGDPAAGVGRVMVALDPTPASLGEAISQSCQLLITHHPLLFKPLKKISTSDETGLLIHTAIRNNLSIIAVHTNYDIAGNGVNDLLARRLDLLHARPLKITFREELVKLAVFVPLTHQDNLLDALLPFSGFPGNYADCSFRVSGLGTFRPLDGAKPFLGDVGKRETVEESRVELLLRKSSLAQAIKALHAAHPYEEPAFDIVPLLNEGQVEGLGRIGELQQPATVEEFAAFVKERLGISYLRLSGDRGKKVSRVALCGGSGSSLMGEAVRQGADLFVTGDMKYHEAREAEAMGIAVLDAGHFATERLMVEGLGAQLEEELARRKFPVAVLRCTAEVDPFEFI